MGDHKDHSVGTVSGCSHCTQIAYEPGWYASLLAFSRSTEIIWFRGVPSLTA